MRQWLLLDTSVGRSQTNQQRMENLVKSHERLNNQPEIGRTTEEMNFKAVKAVEVLPLVTLCDTIYIKTQVFRLLRYYSPAPRNIARSDWATQNITHNMTSSKT